MRLMFLLLPLLLLAPVAEAKKSKKKTKPKSRLSSIAANIGPNLDQSMHFVRLSDGKVLFDLDSKKALVPASVTKLITAAAALDHFDAGDQIGTEIYFNGKRNADLIKGDLIIKGNGDPFLVSEHLWQWAADMRHLGLTKIEGNIVIDNSLFSGDGRDVSRKGGKAASRNAYDAPVSAFGLNFNTYGVVVTPGYEESMPAFVSLDPYSLKGVSVDNHTKTVKKGSKRRLSIHRSTDDTKGLDTIKAKGQMPFNSVIYKKYRSVSNYLNASGELVRAFLAKEGIEVTGEVVEGAVPATAQKLMTLYGYPMRRIVRGLNTYSNNFIADVMLKKLGAESPKVGKPSAAGSGSYENGLHALRKFLEDKVGIDSEFTLENGSGLSVDNRLSAFQVTKLLSYMQKDLRLFPEYLASLPASGWDGTMKRRMPKDFDGLVRAKTGTLTVPVAVAGLAGYLRHPTHGLVAFCILENGIDEKPQPKIKDLRDHQDEFLVQFLKEL